MEALKPRKLIYIFKTHSWIWKNKYKNGIMFDLKKHTTIIKMVFITFQHAFEITNDIIFTRISYDNLKNRITNQLSPCNPIVRKPQ